MKKVKQANITSRYFDKDLNCYVSVCAPEQKKQKRVSKYVTMKERADKLRLEAPKQMNNYDLAVNFGFVEKEAVMELDDLLFRSVDRTRARTRNSNQFHKCQMRHANRN